MVQFQNGMQLLVDSSDKILILMPAAYPGSIGKLLSKGLMNFGAKTVEYGLPQMSPAMPEAENKAEAGRLLKLIEDERVTSIVALPTKIGNKAENFYDVQYRAVKALRKILQEDAFHDIILVTHSAVIRALENNLKGLRVDDPWEPLAKNDFRIIEL